MFGRLIAVASVFGIVTMMSCSRQAPPPPITSAATAQDHALPATQPLAADRVPMELVQIDDAAQQLFDIARTSKWQDAAASVADLHEAVATLSSNGLKADLAAQLGTRIAELTRAVKARQRVLAMDAANSVTHVVAELSSPYQTAVPYQVVLLSYYGRQLELGVATSSPSTLKRATADLRQTWNEVERSILRRGHADDAEHFTDIVVQLEGATRPADFAAPAREELAAADKLAKIFKP